jgi:hypothetical protein
MKNVIPGLVLILLGTQLVAAPPQSAGIVLRLDPVSALAGLPVAILVTLPAEMWEPGDQLPAVLHVTEVATGETFEAAFDDEANVKGWLNLSVQSPSSQGMIEVQQPLDPPWGAPWFAEPRFRKPGTYRLRLQIITTELGMAEDLWSSEATLTVREPEGVDAEAWAWLQSKTKGGWTRLESWNPALMPKLVEAFPSSEYARYGVGRLVYGTGNTEESGKWLQKALELSKGTSIEEYYRLQQVYREAHGVLVCWDDSSGATRADQRKCRSRAAVEGAEKFRVMAAKTSSPAIRQMAEIERKRLQEYVRTLAAVRD